MRITVALLVAFSLANPSVVAARPLVPMPPRVTFVRGPVMTVAAADGATGTITYSRSLDAFARAHEIGHLLDSEVLTDGDRTFFTRLMMVPGTGPWFRGTGTAGLESPKEWFADYYAADATGLDMAAGERVASYAQIGPRRLSRFSRALARFGHRHGLLAYF